MTGAHSKILTIAEAHAYIKGSLFKKRKTELTITIFANCHRYGIEEGLRLANPNIAINSYTTIQPEKLDVAECNRSDFIIVSDLLKLDQYGITNKNIINYPTIVFGAFHPDITPLAFKSSASRQGPPYTYCPVGLHSRIVMECYLRGYSKTDTLTAFNAKTYERLGYFKVLEPEAAQLTHRLKNCGLEGHRFIPKWFAEEGCFMHVKPHPKIGPAMDVLFAVLERQHIPIKNRNILPFITDPLQDIVWPVYPEIAEALRIPNHSSLLFKSRKLVLTLAEFIAISYATYDSINMDIVAFNRVDF